MANSDIALQIYSSRKLFRDALDKKQENLRSSGYAALLIFRLQRVLEGTRLLDFQITTRPSSREVAIFTFLVRIIQISKKMEKEHFCDDLMYQYSATFTFQSINRFSQEKGKCWIYSINIIHNKCVFFKISSAAKVAFLGVGRSS